MTLFSKTAWVSKYTQPTGLCLLTPTLLTCSVPLLLRANHLRTLKDKNVSSFKLVIVKGNVLFNVGSKKS